MGGREGDEFRAVTAAGRDTLRAAGQDTSGCITGHYITLPHALIGCLCRVWCRAMGGGGGMHYRNGNVW